MYHYIREKSHDLPFFRYLDIKNLRKQLDYFENEYGFINFDEWNRYLRDGTTPTSKDKVLLTFDDAVNDHYNYVYKELKKRNLWGIFYVPTAPYTERRILDVHLIHLLCGSIEGAKLYKYCRGIISENLVSADKIEEFGKYIYNLQESYEGVTEFKWILNYFLNDVTRKEILDDIVDYFAFDYCLENFYCSEKQLAEMAQNGMIIGSHTVSHPVMSKLTVSEQRSQIIESFNFLSSIADQELKTYCHPYGGFHSFNDDTIDLLDEQNVDFSFNVESRNIEGNDWAMSKQFLPRYDCVEFKYGNSS